MDYPDEFFYFNNTGIRFYEYGKEGDTLLFIHGFGASSFSWRDIYQPFINSYRVITIDLKGFGLSDKPPDDKYSVFDQTDIVKAFIDEKGLENVVLVGNSLGGAIAIQVYLKYMKENKADNPVKKMILINSAGYKQKIPDYISVLRVPIFNRIIQFLLPNETGVRMILKKVFYDDNKLKENVIKTYASYLETKGAKHSLRKTANQMSIDNIEEVVKEYKKINIPTLIIWGEEDNIIPIHIAYKFLKDIKNSKLKIIGECGHAPQEEKPEAVIPLIEEFLKSS